MARTIDERIVQMTFNNQEFERRANTTISTLGKLGQALNPLKLTGSFSTLQKAGNSLDLSGISDTLFKINHGFNLLEEVAVGAFRRIGQQAADVVTGGLSKFYNALTSMSDVKMMGQGFTKYNDLTSSVQTLVNSTGKSVDEIDGYLKRLMWYSDETSFGFTDMTKALGTMVSSGGDINKLIPMLMGVGNAVAYAGKGASEFTRVIYNLNQSYSSGFLNTMDWRSIELAGVDSKELKEQLLGVAVSLGKVSKGKATLSNFKTLLSDKVFTREVMEQAFSNFAEMTLEAEKLVSEGKFDTAAEAIESLSGKYAEFAERAFRSAQEAKSFKEAVEATQDAVSSGWMQTFQLIFGDYNQSKALWTDVTETFWEIFASGASRRNKILEAWTDIWDDKVNNTNINSASDYAEWKEVQPFLTQTQALVASISDTILGIRDMVVDTYRSVFPIHTMLDEDGNVVEDYSHTARTIYNVVEKIRKAFIDINENGFDSNLAVALRNDFRAILEVIKTIIAYIKTFNSAFIEPLKTQLKPVLDEVVELFNNLGKIIFNTARNARKDMTPFESFLSNILKILNPVISLVANLLHWINDLLNGVGGLKIFDGVFKTIGGVVEWISNAVSGSLPKISKFGEVLSTVFGKVKDAISSFLTSNGANMSKLAEGGFLAYLGYGLSEVIKKFKNLDIAALGKNFLGGVGDGVKNVFTSIKEGIDSLFGKGSKDFSSKLEALSNALIKMAAAVLVLSLVDADKVGSSLKMMAAGLTEMLVALGIFGNMKFKGNLSNPSKTLKRMATAILELSVALKIMSSIDPLGMTTAIVGLGFVLSELSLFMLALSSASKNLEDANTKALASMLTKLGFAMIEISLAMKLIAGLDGNELSRSLIGMGVALAEIGAFTVAVSKFSGEGAAGKIAMIGPAMMGIGLALIEIAAALKLMSTIDQAGMDRALVALFASLGTIALVTVAISKLSGGLKTIAVSAGILIMASAIGALTVSLIALSSIGWNKMKDGLKILAALLGIVGGGAAVLGIFSPLILAFALALTALGGSLIIVSEGIVKAVAAFALLNMLGPDAFGKVVDVLTDAFAMVIALIPSFILGIIEAIIQTASKIIELIGTIIKIIIQAVNDNLPVILAGLVQFITTVLEGLSSAIGNWLPILFDIAFKIINGLITGFREHLPEFAENVYGLIIDAINTVADIIGSGGGGLGAALGKLVSSLFKGIVEAGKGLLGGFAGGIVEWFTGGDVDVSEIGSSISEKMGMAGADAGKELPEQLASGIEQNTQTAISAADTLGSDAAKAMESTSEAKDAAVDTVNGFVGFLQSANATGLVSGAFSGIGYVGISALKQALGIASPSRVMAEQGLYTVLGLAQGVYDNLDYVDDAGTDAANTLLDAMQIAAYNAESILEDDFNPVITPVLDMSDIEANSGQISSLLGNDNSYNAALSISRANSLNGIQNGLLNGLQSPFAINVNFTINEAGGELTEADFIKFGNEIANIVNEKLGGLV